MSKISLSLTIPLQPGEEAVAFLSRLAARNGIPFVRGFCADMGLALHHVVDGRAPDLTRVADLAGVDAMALMAASVRKEGPTFRVRGESMVAASLRRNRFFVCPACLMADIAGSKFRPHIAAYGRLAWRIEAIRTCVRHDMALVELEARSGVTNHDFAAMVRPNLERLDDLDRQALRRPASELERYVQRRLDGAARDVPFLDGLELHVAIRLCEVVGALSVHGRGVHLSRLGDDDLRFSGGAGIAIASGGEEALCAFLGDLQRAYPFGRRVKAGPRTPIAEFRAWLAGQSRQPCYAPVRSVLNRHLAQARPVDIPGKRRLLPWDRTERAYAKLMIGRPLIIRSGFTEYLACRLAMNRSLEMPRGDRLLHTLVAQDATHHLSCDMSLFQGMVAHGLVTPVQGTVGAGWRHLFAKADLDAVLAGLFESSEPVARVMDGMVGIREAIARTLCAPMEIMHLVLGGQLTWVGRHRRAAGFASLLVRLDEVRAKLLVRAIDGPTFSEAADLLSCEHEHVAALIGMGAMTRDVGVYAHTGVSVECVTAQSIDLFRTRYVGSLVLGAKLRLNHVEVVAHLSASGLGATYADESQGFAYFDRRELARVRGDLEFRQPMPWAKDLHRSYKRED